MIIYAIIPARSGSKGLINKNIKQLSGKPLLAYSIEFAKKLKIDRIFCSTNSKKYAKIAIKHGAEVPFLRSEQASSSSAMEQDILKDLYYNFKKENIPQPDLLVWLRPTFVFRNLSDVMKCIDLLKRDSSFTSARTICEGESRLYKLDDKILTSTFEDEGKSMIRRQDILSKYKVFSTDVFRSNKENISDNFLGNKIAGIITNKLCGLDIDDELDFRIVENLLNNNQKLINENT
jgi:CMP-N-acetylneuraminic acid synthetase